MTIEIGDAMFLLEKEEPHARARRRLRVKCAENWGLAPGTRRVKCATEKKRETLAASSSARKKSSQKSTRPRGAKDVATFPGAIGRNNACVRADLQQVALGGRKRLPRVGECIVADGRLPCQRQPLRGQPVPSQGVDPSTWFVGLRGDGLNRSNT